MAVGDTYFESDGKALHVDLLYTVAKGRVGLVDGWLGIFADNGDSGETVALTVDGREYQVVVPTALAASKGDIIYIETGGNFTGHYPDDDAWNTDASGTLPIPFMKVTQDQDSNDVVTGILLRGYVAAG